jgi:hypothetical protein
MGDEIWLVLHPIPDEFTSYCITSLRYLRPAGKVSVKILPLHVSITEGYEDRGHVMRQETSLGIEVITLIPPEKTRPSQIRTLSDDLWKKRFIGQQGISRFLPVKIYQA